MKWRGQNKIGERIECTKLKDGWMIEHIKIYHSKSKKLEDTISISESIIKGNIRIEKNYNDEGDIVSFLLSNF